jgi:hypothetical protein
VQIGRRWRGAGVGMSRYAEKTDVTSSKSRDEVERTLERYGADQFIYGWQESQAVVGFRMGGRQVRFSLPLPARDDKAFTEYVSRGKPAARAPDAAAKLYEQALRQRWRALALVIKAKLEAVESGISIFEDEFMANIVLPDGSLVGEWMRPQIAEAYRIGTMPTLLPALSPPAKREAD